MATAAVNREIGEYDVDEDDPNLLHVWMGDDFVLMDLNTYCEWFLITDGSNDSPSTCDGKNDCVIVKHVVNGPCSTKKPNLTQIASIDDDEYMLTEDKVKFRFSVLDMDELVILMRKTIGEVKEVAQFPDQVLRSLLTHFKWDIERLYERLFDSESESARKKLFKEANISYTDIARVPLTPLASIDGGKTCQCSICFDDFNSGTFTSLTCGHYFCKDCWGGYITTSVKEGLSGDLVCPGYKCTTLVPDELVVDIVKDEQCRKTYIKLITFQFVEFSKSLRWCPGVECGRVIKCDDPIGARTNPVKCDCRQVSQRLWIH